jgi:hypothetical protein
MKTSLFFTQRKPLTVKILGAVLFVLGCLVLLEDNAELTQIITMFGLNAILVGYSNSFEIRDSFDHKKHFKLFGITLFKQRLDVFSPEYIVVFSVTSGKSSEWGPIAAMGNTNKESSFVIRLFRENQKFTVWRTSSSSQAQRRAMELSQLLGVEIRS